MPPNNKPPIFDPNITQPIPRTEDLNSPTPEESTFGEWTAKADKRFNLGMTQMRGGKTPAKPLSDLMVNNNGKYGPVVRVVSKGDTQKDNASKNTTGGMINMDGNVPSSLLPGNLKLDNIYTPPVALVSKLPPPTNSDTMQNPPTAPNIPSITHKPFRRTPPGAFSSVGSRLLGVLKKTSSFFNKKGTTPNTSTEINPTLKNRGLGIKEGVYSQFEGIKPPLTASNEEPTEQLKIPTTPVIPEIIIGTSAIKKSPSVAQTILNKTASPNPLPQPNNVLQTLAKEAGEKLYLSYSGKKDTSLSKTQLNALLGINTTSLTKKQINDLVDVAIKKDLEKLRAKKSPVPTVSITTKVSTPLTKTVDEILPPEDLFEDGFDDEMAKKEASQERLRNWKERLGNVATTTKNKLETTLEKLGPQGKKLVSLLTQGSEYLNSQTNSKAVKLFAAAGLVSAGALAAYATPVVLASMAGVGFSLRVVSAAGLYKIARKQLDKKYESWEREGKKKSVLSMTGYEAGAIGFALFSGEIVGRVFEGIASMPIIQEVGTSIKNIANVASLTEYWTNFWNGEVPPSATVGAQPEASTPVKDVTITTAESAAALTTPPNPDLQHVVKKGDNLWSLLRKDLANMQLDGFSDLSSGKQERIMRAMLDELNANGNIPSGTIDKIYPGEVIDYNKIDFKNYLDKYLKN